MARNEHSEIQKKLFRYRDGFMEVRIQRALLDEMPDGLRQCQRAYYDRAKGRAAAAYAEIMKMCAVLPEPERDIIQLRYIRVTPAGRPRTWQEIARAMGYSQQHVKRLHAQALARLEGLRE